MKLTLLFIVCCLSGNQIASMQDTKCPSMSKRLAAFGKEIQAHDIDWTALCDIKHRVDLVCLHAPRYTDRLQEELVTVYAAIVLRGLELKHISEESNTSITPLFLMYLLHEITVQQPYAPHSKIGPCDLDKVVDQFIAESIGCRKAALKLKKQALFRSLTINN